MWDSNKHQLNMIVFLYLPTTDKLPYTDNRYLPNTDVLLFCQADKQQQQLNVYVFAD